MPSCWLLSSDDELDAGVKYDAKDPAELPEDEDEPTLVELWPMRPDTDGPFFEKSSSSGEAAGVNIICKRTTKPK